MNLPVSRFGRSSCTPAARLIASVFFFAALASSSFSPDAFAHRGENFSRQDEEPVSPTRGYPGFLDTHTAPKGNWVAEIPTGFVDYGATENLTIGTNVLAPAIGLGLGGPAMLLKARYRFFTSDRFSSSVTGYYGRAWNLRELGHQDGLDEDGASERFDGTLAAGTWNGSYHLGSGDLLTFHLSLISIHSSKDGPGYEEFGYYDRKSALIVAPGAGYQKLFSGRNGGRIQVLLPSLRSREENPVDDTVKDIGFGGQDWYLPMRVLYDHRSSKSLFSAGILALVGEGRILPLPLVSWTFQL